jgi:hypothetical protein
MKLHKLTQEQFDKLPQLDRIELRQKRDFLERHKVELQPTSFLWTFFMLAGFIMLVAIGVWNINFDSAVRIMSLIPMIIKVGAIGTIVLTILDLAFEYKHRKEMDKVYDYYFQDKVEVKKK